MKILNILVRCGIVGMLCFSLFLVSNGERTRTYDYKAHSDRLDKIYVDVDKIMKHTNKIHSRSKKVMKETTKVKTIVKDSKKKRGKK